ncbi:MAG: TolC family protein [Bacteroidetes bacterium]|nr:MAG: TolC family protein [Bacteroidota bacterium]MBL1143550.1 TolC family protein [Bacteroidota bacterium]NOG56352.1 TolC family protein [Bacteroidota bacterium]
MKNIKSSIQSYFLTGVFALLSISVQAQPETKQWTLEECINHALENNIQIQQSELNLLITNQNLAQSKYGMLPNINGFASHTYNFGQTIDPFTNQFATSQVRSNSLSLSSSVTLFNGFQTLNTVKKNQADLQASRFDMEKMQNDISLNIANFYLQILFSHELVKNAERQLQVTSGQITRIQKLVDAGSLPEGNLREIQAQYASEELQKINAENQLNITTLNLAQILRLEDASNFDVVMPNLESFQGVSELITPGALYLTALETMPEVKSAEYSYYSAEKSKDIARGAYSPNLSATGSIGSGFSENNKEFADGELRVKPFNDQLDDNFNKSVGFRINIPIFNGMSARSNVQRAKLSLEIAELNLEDTKLQLRQKIESAHNDAIAALKRYKAAEKSVDALNLSFNYTKQRFDVGMLNSFEFNNEKNRLNNAESELLQAKYEYIFKTKVLDFYQGKAISFNK